MVEQFLLYRYPWILEALLAAWAALICVNFSTIVSALKPNVTKQGLAAAALIFGGALLIRLEIFPPRHQVYFDEFIHEDIAGNIARANAFGETLIGGSDERRELHAPAWPGGYHVLLGGLFKLTGTNEAAASRFNAVMASASVVLVFLLATVLFSDQWAGLLSALLLCALPVHIRFSATTDLTACSLFWILSALLALALCFKQKSGPLLMLFLVTALYAANVRFENLILFPMAGMLFMSSPKQFPSMTNRQSVLGAVSVLLVLTPVIAVILLNRVNGMLGFDTPLSSVWLVLAQNIPANLRYLVGAPAVVLVPAIAAGLILAPKEDAAWARRLLIIGLGYLFLCALHSRGDFHTGTSERLSLPIFLSLILAAAAGFKAISERTKFRKIFSGAMLIAFILLNRSSYGQLPLERYEAEYRLVKETAGRLPPGAYVLTYCAPLIMTLTKNPAVSALLIPSGSGALLDEFDQEEKNPLILFKDVWWYKLSERSAPLERELQRRYNIEPLRTETIDSKEYGFYLLTRKTSGGAPPTSGTGRRRRTGA